MKSSPYTIWSDFSSELSKLGMILAFCCYFIIYEMCYVAQLSVCFP